MEREGQELGKAQRNANKNIFKYAAESDSGLKDSKNQIHQTKKEPLWNRKTSLRTNRVVAKVVHFLSLFRKALQTDDLQQPDSRHWGLTDIVLPWALG